MRPAEVAHRGAEYLARHGVASPEAESQALLMRILKIDRSAVFLRQEGLTTAEAKAFGRALCRRCTGTPLQHLTGEQGFRRLVIEVRPGVFVPRPETEVLAGVALEHLTGDGPIVVDLCTGSGAVALAIADECPRADVFATDLSNEAVELARANAERLDLDLEVFVGDLFEPLPNRLRGRLDLAVANPPYIPQADEVSLPPEVRADPPTALYGDLELYERVFTGAAVWLRPGGAVVVEIDQRRASDVADRARRAGLEGVRVVPDLTGRDRVVAATRP